MTDKIDENIIYRLAEASRDSALRARVAEYITRHFRSMHYLSSKLICDCVILNLLLSKEITPSSANEYIVCMRRKFKSMYTTVDSAFFPIENRFADYARSVLGDDYEQVRNESIRTTNFIIYVLSLDISRHEKFNPYEVFLRAFSYDELLKIDLPR